MALALRIEPQQRDTMHSSLIANIERCAAKCRTLDEAEAFLAALELNPQWWRVTRGGHHVAISFVGGTYNEPVRVAMIAEREAVEVVHVTTVSGSAGGTGGVADVTLRVQGVADTVEAMRERVATACLKHDALVAALRGLYAQVEKGFLINHGQLCQENRDENARACEAAYKALEGL